jgi:hypothetical protein
MIVMNQEFVRAEIVASRDKRHIEPLTHFADSAVPHIRIQPPWAYAIVGQELQTFFRQQLHLGNGDND